MQAKSIFCAGVGAIGGAVSAVFGGWDAALGALVCAMVIDYVTGLIVAGVFHKSTKSPGGGLESRVGWKGLARKFVTLLIVVMAQQMDRLMGTSYLRDAVIIGFVANEAISILENAGLMGLPIPGLLKKAIDILKEKGDENHE